MKTETKTVDAIWDAQQNLYCCHDLECWSSDGDTWHDDHGGQPDSEEFHTTTICLVGGPRDGVTVA